MDQREIVVTPGSDPRVYIRIAADLRGADPGGRARAHNDSLSITLLTARYGVARGTAAKALGVLVGEGTVKRWPGLGYIVE